MVKEHVPFTIFLLKVGLYHFLTFAYLTDDRWYLIVVLICFSLITTEDETVFIFIGHVLDRSWCQINVSFSKTKTKTKTSEESYYQLPFTETSSLCYKSLHAVSKQLGDKDIHSLSLFHALVWLSQLLLFPADKALLLLPFNRWGSWASRSLCDLLKVMQQVSDRI